MGEAKISLASEEIDLNINTTFVLDNISSVEFDRVFSVSQKQDISLLHINCESTKNEVNDVLINITLNGVETSETFEDSSSSYSSPHTFSVGTTLTLQIEPTTPIYILSNTIKVEVSVSAGSLFTPDKGDFKINEVNFETFTPPTIAQTSENTDLPLRISQGNWYISQLTTLSERKLESKIFCNIVEDIRVRIDISLDPSTLPLSSTEFSIITPHSTFENDDSSAPNSIIADLIKGDTLLLNFKFRPSSELANSVVNLSINVTVSNSPSIPTIEWTETTSELNLFPLPTSTMEALRLLMFLIPLSLLYKRKIKKEMSEKDNLNKKK
jgi:hypothetical protein